MKKILVVLLLACIPFGITYAKEITVTMNKISAAGLGESLGVVKITQTSNGLRMTPNLNKMPVGLFEFSINKTSSCQSIVSETGIIAGLAADSSLMQLPMLRVAGNSTATTPVDINNVSFSDLSRRTLVITSISGIGFGDGERIACGSLEQY